MDRRIMYGLFLPLYMSQYLGIGFLFTALAAITRERGGDLEEIGVIYVLGMVWAVKFLWAPLVDRFGSRRLGHYRSWLLVTQPATALAVVMIAPFDVLDNLGLIIAALAVVAILSSTQDIATDALAVRTMRGSGRGGVNGLQVGAGFVGDIIGGGGVLVVYDLFGLGPGGADAGGDHRDPRLLHQALPRAGVRRAGGAGEPGAPQVDPHAVPPAGPAEVDARRHAAALARHAGRDRAAGTDPDRLGDDHRPGRPADQRGGRRDQHRRRAGRRLDDPAPRPQARPGDLRRRSGRGHRLGRCRWPPPARWPGRSSRSCWSTCSPRRATSRCTR